jgi:hypothetical protein
MIKIKYSSVDGGRMSRSFKSLKGARAFAQKMVGKNPEMGSSYAVSGDGIGKIEAYGAAGKLTINTQDFVLADLFGDADLMTPE